MNETFKTVLTLASKWRARETHTCDREDRKDVVGEDPGKKIQFIAAERQLSSLEVITLDDRLALAAKRQGFVLTTD